MLNIKFVMSAILVISMATPAVAEKSPFVITAGSIDEANDSSLDHAENSEIGPPFENYFDLTTYQEKLIAQCMVGKGLKYTPEMVDPDLINSSLRPQHSDIVGHQQFEYALDQAIESGYGTVAGVLHSEDNVAPAESPNEIIFSELPDSDKRVYGTAMFGTKEEGGGCFSESYKAAWSKAFPSPEVSQETQTEIEEEGLLDRVAANPRIVDEKQQKMVDAKRQWQVCMASQGFDFENSVEAAESIRFQLENELPPGLLTSEGSQEELQDAISNPEIAARLQELLELERKTAKTDVRCSEEIFELEALFANEYPIMARSSLRIPSSLAEFNGCEANDPIGWQDNCVVSTAKRKWSELARAIQSVMRRDGEPGFVNSADGIYGNKTRDAVKLFQEDQGLDDDGIVGPDTWNALFMQLRLVGEDSDQEKATYKLDFGDLNYFQVMFHRNEGAKWEVKKETNKRYYKMDDRHWGP